MDKELLKELDVQFSLQQIVWLTENTDLEIVFKDGVAFEYVGVVNQ